MSTSLKKLGFIVLGGIILLGCEKVMDGTDGGTGTPDAGPNTACPAELPSPEVTCERPECDAPADPKLFGEATLDSTEGTSSIIPVWATSEVAGANDNATIDYATAAGGALSAAGRAGHPGRDPALQRARVEAFLGAEVYATVFRSERVERVRAEAAIRAMQRRDRYSFAGVSGTAVRGRTRELLPRGARTQQAACSAAAPSCGESMLCVIPENATDGTCEGALSLKFRTDQTNFELVNATVKKVGTYGAIVVDDADAASLGDTDAAEILDRFNRHIAPLDHQFFGEPRNAEGKDRDGNGVVIFFLTKRVTTRGGASLVGYFQSDDLIDSATEMTSNAADILYMQPPGGAITLAALSGTIGHEYQHLINYYQKKILRQSGPEDLWLDEGLATFAEDMLGYGGDAFENIAAYLGTVDQVSLTGANLTAGEEDSVQRRGMAHLLVRYLFEQGGGATFQSPGAATDRGGVAAVKKLVQSADTGTLLFTTEATGRSFSQWVGALLTTVAIDGAGFPDVSCNPKYSLIAPETDTFTGNQRGIDLRTRFMNSRGQGVDLTGPITAVLGNDTGVPLPANGGEIRTADVASGTLKISIFGSVDYEVGFRPLPAEPVE